VSLAEINNSEIVMSSFLFIRAYLLHRADEITPTRLFER
jgi:hypothetical protein